MSNFYKKLRIIAHFQINIMFSLLRRYLSYYMRKRLSEGYAYTVTSLALSTLISHCWKDDHSFGVTGLVPLSDLSRNGLTFLAALLSRYSPVFNGTGAGSVFGLIICGLVAMVPPL